MAKKTKLGLIQKMAKQLCDLEGGASQVNIAQMQEVLKKTAVLFQADKDFRQMFLEYGDQAVASAALKSLTK